MSKLNEIIEKIKGLQTQLSEKVDKITFIKKWREKRTGAAKKLDPTSLSAIYREGSTGTRIQVLVIYAFLFVALISAGSLVRKIIIKVQSSAGAEAEKMRQEFSHQFAEANRKAAENVQMLSLGQFTANAYVGPPEMEKILSIDIWAKVSDPDTANYVNFHLAVFREKASDALHELYLAKVNLFHEDGKKIAKEKLRAYLNKSLSKGSFESIFIQNLITQ